MAKMNTDEILRPEPGGEKSGAEARDGELVRILSTDGDWTKVKLLDFPGQPEGWVPSLSVSKEDVPPVQIDKTVFARECWQQALFYEVNAHYLAALGEFCSHVSTGQQKGGFGPFCIDQAEWNEYVNDPTSHLAFAPERIEDWGSQCSVIGLITGRNDEALTRLLGRRESAAELYLAYLLGPTAAGVLIQCQASTVKDALESVKDDRQLPRGGLTRPQLIDRYGRFITGGTAGATGKQVLDQIAAALQGALNIMRPFVLKTGTDVLGAPAEVAMPATTGSPVPGAKAPSQTLQLAQQALTQLRADGWTKEQACGIIANIQAESSFNFKENTGDGGKAYGLCQWEGNRRDHFQKKIGPNIVDSTFEQQLKFITIEMDNFETIAREALKKAKTAADAAEAVCRKYERPQFPDKDSQIRRGLAEAYMRTLA